MKKSKEYYANTVQFADLQNVTMYEGTIPDLLENVVIEAGSEAVDVSEYTIDFSVDDEQMFAEKEAALVNTKEDDSDNNTKIKCVCSGVDDKEALAKLVPGTYNIHYSAMHPEKPSVRLAKSLRL